jgi:hypothetical protein
VTTGEVLEARPYCLNGGYGMMGGFCFADH